MTQLLCGSVVTPMGIAANNRGENEGNMTTLQKVVCGKIVRTTVSAEALRFAIRIVLSKMREVNRSFDASTGTNVFLDAEYEYWRNNPDGKYYADDDALGYMNVSSRSEEAEPPTEETDKKTTKRAKAPKKSGIVRKSVFEVTRSLSLLPWCGDKVFNAALPGSSKQAERSADPNPVPYGAEVHATRYQYGFGITPSALRDRSLAAVLLSCLCSVSHVGGNHSRFLYDYSPESILIRVTDDLAPRVYLCFEEGNNDGVVRMPRILRLARAGDIKAEELYIGGLISETPEAIELAKLGASVFPGVLKAAEIASSKIDMAE